MTKSITIVVPVEPKGKGRPRCSCRGRKPSLRTPTTTRAFERAVARVSKAAAAAAAWQVGRYTPLRMELTAVFPRPDRRPSHIPSAAWSTGRRVYRPSVPDRDNVEKAVEDGLQAGGVVVNDAQLCAGGDIANVYAAVGEAACVEITITKLGWLP